jgi:purine-cytosine permease-like protein
VSGTVISAYSPASDLPGHIERRGIEEIPESERYAKPKDLGWVFFGTQMCYGSLVIGALPVTFGLNWLGALTAILTGTLIGSLAVAAMALLGPLSGTNGTVTSSAFFGQRGRYVGSFITQTIDIGYFALILWVSAPPMVQVGHLLFGLPDGHFATTVALLLVAALVFSLGIFGHATLVFFEKFTSLASLFCIALSVWFCIGHFKPAPAASVPLVLGRWWPSWMLAVTVLISNAISYAPFAGDYARYLPRRSSSWSVFFWPLAGMVAGCVLACGAGAVIALSVSDPNNVVSLMFDTMPHFLLLPVLAIGLIANASNGGMVIYNGMLDLQAILWRLKRPQVGILFSFIGLIVSYLGLIVYNLVDSILALCAIVTILVTPWIIINLIGFLRQGRQFLAADLQAFTHRQQRGRYWYQSGFNVPAMAAWLLSVLIGLLFSNTALYTGPLSQLADGIDLSFLSAAGIGAIFYLSLDFLMPSNAQILKGQPAAKEPRTRNAE